MRLFIALAIALQIVAGNAFAVDLATAQKTVAAFKAIEKPTKTSTTFEHWRYNTAAMITTTCLREAGKPERDVNRELGFAGPTQAGTFAYPNREEIGPFCAAAASGFRFGCYLANVDGPTVRHSAMLPPDYIQLGGDWRRPQLNGGFYCSLGDNVGPRQFFSTPVHADWVQQPAARVFAFPRGPAQLRSGTLLITAPGVPGMPGGQGKGFSEPRTAVVSGSKVISE